MTKAELRTYYRDLRSRLSEQEEEELNNSLFHNLKKLNWQHVKFCHVFLPILKFHEPNTFLLISYFRENFPDINLVISKSDMLSQQMTHYVYNDSLVLENNKWGILEPVEGIAISETKLDVVLIPLLISDKRGNRVGYGKGYYDRFLSLCRSDVKKIGLSFFEPIDLIQDVDPHDIPLDICVTPQEIYTY
ncbi:5-formyltetrahydrofolate cyclo-ligase [Sphingobacterium sp. SRCM116780]|uniref:5-formyltetrahydrofolate cyclo-ligase n=1 Tax=Sphingobacterium sp. SRCM116780 TaxID=2907623 RepID=UPI001F478092|nr:5-formyltetrahydrofolate cyclo-ligase [Sphingobacterium sp. SRCM116780]UIR55578.1 5-formyltetrahydrofolate cyclo-ligase [Sphingobacterium sp. SRCM116780]